MRYIRTSSNSKQNKENAFLNDYDKERMEELRLEIKSAYTQINMLKETNKKLAWKVQLMEKEIQNNELIKQEIQFLKEQQNNYKQQLNSQDEINRKLRQQLDKTERLKNQLQQRLRSLINGQQGKLTCRIQTNRSEKISLAQNNHELSTQINQSKSLKTPYQTSARVSMVMSLSNQRSKENHQSTPKSKLKINLDNFMAPQNPNHRKKVFF